jgi:hypothetical protein
MANPTVTASLDKTTYSPGDQMVLTVNYGDTDSKAVKVTVTVEDAEGNKSAPVVVNAVIDPLTVAVTDADRTWTKQTDNGATAVYKATA